MLKKIEKYSKKKKMKGKVQIKFKCFMHYKITIFANMTFQLNVCRLYSSQKIAELI